MSSAPYGSPPPPRRRGVKAGLGISLAATHLVEERYHVCVYVRTSFVARVSHEAISEVEPLSTDI